jgi:hypothetical protein
MSKIKGLEYETIRKYKGLTFDYEDMYRVINERGVWRLCTLKVPMFDKTFHRFLRPSGLKSLTRRINWISSLRYVYRRIGMIEMNLT